MYVWCLWCVYMSELGRGENNKDGKPNKDEKAQNQKGTTEKKRKSGPKKIESKIERWKECGNENISRVCGYVWRQEDALQ